MLEAWQAFLSLFVFVSGLLFSIKISKYFGVKQKHSAFLYVWHTFFCLVYFWYASFNVNDAYGYFLKASAGAFELKPGTNAVVLVNYIFINVFKLSFLGSFLVNNIFGFLGLLAFKGALDTSTRLKSKNVRKLAWIIVLLPSVSFWTSALGKDSIAFMATGFALWASLNIHKRYYLMAFSVLAMFLVRPHMAGMLIIALAISMAFNANLNIVRRVVIGTVACAIAALVVPFAIQYAGISDPTSPEAIMDYVEGRQSVNMGGGSSVDISSMSLPAQLFTYVFRPSLIEARNVFTLAAGIDNFILLFLFFIGGRSLLKKKNMKLPGNRSFMWIYVGLAWLVLAMTTPNLGIAIRQKWMFAPILIYLLISVMGSPRQVIYNRTTLLGNQVLQRHQGTLHSDKAS